MKTLLLKFDQDLHELNLWVSVSIQPLALSAMIHSGAVLNLTSTAFNKSLVLLNIALCSAKYFDHFSVLLTCSDFKHRLKKKRLSFLSLK